MAPCVAQLAFNVVPDIFHSKASVYVQEEEMEDNCETESVHSASTILSCRLDSITSQTSAGSCPHVVCRLPDFALPLQPKLLKQINLFNTKEELLNYVAPCHFLLDPINLVTCVYRLARMFCNVRSTNARQTWRAELYNNNTFQLLLRAIQSHMLHAQLMLMHNEEVKGLDARCVSNLIWAIIKLELSNESGSLGEELILTASPLVVRFLPQSSSQGLANLLWAYAKMPVPPVEVMMVIVLRMGSLLQADATQFDAQALSNSVWALAHIRSKVSDLDAVAGRHGAVLGFMRGIANTATQMLRTLNTRLDISQLHNSMTDAEKRFSCQAMVNIVWSFATMLGEECNDYPEFKAMFLQIRREAILRLQATLAGLQTNQPWVRRLHGGFNEQALSNIVYAYDKTQLLDKDLLQCVFNVAALRLDRMENKEISFKPQELCTLLRASHQYIAAPWPFLNKLLNVVQTYPWIINSWSAVELTELNRAFALLKTNNMQQQQQLLSSRIPAHVQLPMAFNSMPSALVASSLDPAVMELLLAQEGFNAVLQQHQHQLARSYAAAGLLGAILPRDL